MKTVFIYNEYAGRSKKTNKIADITLRKDDAEHENCTYTTKGVGDAERYIKDYCTRNGGARFVACGGDGTLSEVLNGVINCGGCEVAVLPMGTGNDFCRNFEPCSILAEANTYITQCDAIRCTLTGGCSEKTVYCANMINIGFDCNAADLTSTLKKKTIVSGTLAYLISVFVTLIKKKTSSITIETDGGVIHDGEFLLTTIANGSYCGGGFMSNPLASVCDGMIDFNIIKNVSRLKFISLLPSYKKGTFLNKNGIEKIVSSGKAKSIKITSQNGTIKVCIDGEIYEACEAVFDIVPAAFKFAGKQKSV